jgi:hypothetical protein
MLLMKNFGCNGCQRWKVKFMFLATYQIVTLIYD